MRAARSSRTRTLSSLALAAALPMLPLLFGACSSAPPRNNSGGKDGGVDLASPAMDGSVENDGSTATDLAKADLVTNNSGPPFDVVEGSEAVGDATVVTFVPQLPAGAKAPLVVVKHGFLLATSNYQALCNTLAADGFVVIGVDTAPVLFLGPTNVDERDQTTDAIDWALNTAPFASRIADQPIAVIGHSRGGKVAVMAAAADSRIDAALLLDPVNGCGPGQGYSSTCPDITTSTLAGALAIPVGVMGETNNATGGLMPCAPTDQNYTTVFSALTNATWAVQWTFTGADHMDFTDDGGGSIGGQCPDGPGDDTTIRADVRTLALAFVRRHLRNDTTSDAILSGASLPSGITKVGP